MSSIQNYGNPDSKIWVVIDRPFDNDGHLIFDGGYGYHFHKMWEDAGLPYDNKFITCYKPDLSLQYDDEMAVTDLVSEINRYKPPFLIILGKKATSALLPQTRSFKKPFEARVESFAGSLLISPQLNYEHYCVCTHSPDVIIGHWDYRDILVSMDLGRVRDEFEYYKKNLKLQPLPTYDITVNPTYEELMEKWLLHEFKDAAYLSTDIETIRPKKSTASFTSQFKGNPGFPYLLGLADNSHRGLSFSFWSYNDYQSVRIWKAVDNLLSRIPQIGQNYFNFDGHFLEAFGFKIRLKESQDTMIRHHILWPELPHALQFLTKQYTRQPYYKDEGKGFTPRNQAAVNKYMTYNVYDAIVTYGVFEGQELEFNDRPHLR